MLREVDAVDAIELARAFTTYFHLATVAEQTHRIALIDSREEADRGRLSLIVDRIREAGWSIVGECRDPETCEPADDTGAGASPVRLRHANGDISHPGDVGGWRHD